LRLGNLRPKISEASAELIHNLTAASNTARVVRLMLMYTAQATLAKIRIKDPKKRLEFYTRNVSYWTKRCLEVMSVEVEVVGFDTKLMSHENFLMVSNHMSYIDVLALSSIMPAVFVTSVDMQETPLLGDLAEMGGSIFVERRHRSQIGQDISTMSKALRDGHNVMIYPEGTSTDGQKLLPFKKSLLMAAVEAQKNILPVCLKYTEIDGEPFSAANAHKVAWYGEMTFAPHLLQMMKLSKVKARIEFLQPIKVHANSTRHELAAQAFSAIHTAYTGQAPEADLESEPEQKSKVGATQVHLGS
jgi:1-acyl-sn-glycerol-3-phosphate acyltransferase